MVGASPGLLILACSLLLLLRPLWLCSAASGKPICREEERSALLGFKNSFFNETYCFEYVSSSPLKMMLWKAEEGKAGDCCDWGGVTCDVEDGHVIGLDLSSSCLTGRVDSKASIFDLVHLQELNLAYNSFDSSPIPTAMQRLTRLTRLNLSSSSFGGEVVPEMMMPLSNLSLLDLSRNGAMNISGLEELFKCLNKLEELDLTQVTVSDGKVPRSLGNMTSLRSLVLSDCGLSGKFPDSVFELPRLEFLDVRNNDGLTGRLTGFHRGSPLKSLKLSGMNLTGELPTSLGNLSHLTGLDLRHCGLRGELPSSIGDLTNLESLGLGFNELHGQIPSSLGNLTNLTGLNLSGNKFHGPIPQSIYGLQNLGLLFLRSNYLTDVARLDLLLELKGLAAIDLSFNAFSSVILPKPNVNGSQIEFLFLDSCNLTEVPQFLKQNRGELKVLTLSNNNISGEIPKWLLQRNLWYLNLSFNFFRGTLPIPPNSIHYYQVSKNRLSGEIPSSICELENMEALDLSDNDFTGVLPSCLVNLSSTLGALSLSGNNFGGKIPQVNNERCTLAMMDLSSNSFEGPLPRSLTNCRGLEYVDFGRNKITDTFPSWLGSLPQLKVLMLHSNRFHGLMEAPQNNSWFPSLKIFYMSLNNLHGPLPANFFTHLSAMKYPSPDDDEYPNDVIPAMEIMIIDKGIEREFGKTMGSFTLLDLSSNNFSGTIPESIGDNLLKLHTLNLSNNHLSGAIPQSLANLRNLEVLDLSRNRLSGEIPRMLLQVTSLGIFNVSYNNLSGSIPGGNQFGTFENTSYIGNPWLCGGPLTKRCGNPPQSPPGPAGNRVEKSSLPLGIVWITALVGLAGGLVVGVALETAFGDDVLYWLERKWRKYRTSTA